MPGPVAFDASTPGRGADEAVTRLRDHERRADADEPGALAQDRLDVARIPVHRELARPRGRLELVEPHDAPLRLGDDLLRDDDDVGVLEPARAVGCGREQRREVVPLFDLRDALEREDPDSVAHVEAGEAEARVGLVAPVHVHDHRGHALERAGARERAAVDGAARDEPARELERELLRDLVVAADERVLVGRRLGEVRGRERVQAGGDGRVELGLDPLRDRGRLVVGMTPPGPNVSSAQTERTGVEPIDWRSSRAVSSAASALTAKTTRSTPRTASSFEAPVAPSGSAASRARSASREPITTVDARVDEPLRERLPEASRAAHDRDSHAGRLRAPVSARRRDASRSVISVRVTIGRTASGPAGSDSSITSASIRPA